MLLLPIGLLLMQLSFKSGNITPPPCVAPSFLSDPNTIAVNLGNSLGAFQCRGCGILLGLDTDQDVATLITPLHIKRWRASPNTNWLFESTLNAVAVGQGMIPEGYLSVHAWEDSGIWPGDGGDWTRWESTGTDGAGLNAVPSIVTLMKTNYPSVTREYDIWNEPDSIEFWNPPGPFGGGNPFTSAQNQLFNVYTHAYDIIHAQDPTGKIVCCSLTNFNLSWFQTFYSYMKNHGARYPDILSWHDLNSTVGSISSYKSQIFSYLEAQGIPEPQIELNEIGGSGVSTTPAIFPLYWGSAERNGINMGKSSWGVGHSPWTHHDLGQTLTDDGANNRRSVWWIFNAYASMTGTSYYTYRSNDNCDGVATKDGTTVTVVAGCGGNAYGSITSPMKLLLYNIPAAMTDSLLFSLSNLTDSGNAQSTGPAFASSSVAAVTTCSASATFAVNRTRSMVFTISPN